MGAASIRRGSGHLDTTRVDVQKRDPRLARPEYAGLMWLKHFSIFLCGGWSRETITINITTSRVSGLSHPVA